VTYNLVSVHRVLFPYRDLTARYYMYHSWILSCKTKITINHVNR
jgi:hypothetical protein